MIRLANNLQRLPLLCMILGALLLLTISGYSYGVEDINFNKKYDKYANKFEFVVDESDDVDFQVIYFFNYNCDSCRKFEELISDWEKNISKNISILSIPFSPVSNWLWADKLHYSKHFIKEGITREDVFNSEYLIKGNKVTHPTSAGIVLSEISGDKLDKSISIVKSKEVSSLVKFSSNVANKFHIKGTPSLIIIHKDGDTYTTGANYNLTYSDIIKVTNAIIDYKNKGK